MSAKKYCVARWEKYRRSDVHGLQRECNREYSDPSRYKNDVDLSRTSENIYLQKCNDWDAEISHVLEREGIKERSDSVVLVGGIYTASGDWMVIGYAKLRKIANRLRPWWLSCRLQKKKMKKEAAERSGTESDF